jgi:hypothetical protein
MVAGSIIGSAFEFYSACRHFCCRIFRNVAASAPSGGSVNVRATNVHASDEWSQQLDQRIYQCVKLWVEQWWDPQQCGLLEATGQVFGEHRASVRETITNLKERVIRRPLH